MLDVFYQVYDFINDLIVPGNTVYFLFLILIIVLLIQFFYYYSSHR